MTTSLGSPKWRQKSPPRRKWQHPPPKEVNQSQALPMISPVSWEVLWQFDSEAAAWVSGATETVDYFG